MSAFWDFIEFFFIPVARRKVRFLMKEKAMRVHRVELIDGRGGSATVDVFGRVIWHDDD